MKLPAVAITAAFACGVALGLCPPLVRLATSHLWLATAFLAATLLIIAGMLLLNREVTVLAPAKRPQVFRDEGAFDRRAYLATQGIDLVATLRSPELIHRLSAAPRTASTVLARTRRELRDEVDRLFDGRPEVPAVLRAMPQLC